MELFAEWAHARGLSLTDPRGPEAAAAREWARKRALAEIKTLHASSPKYTFGDESQEDVIRRYAVKVIKLSTTYLPSGSARKAQVLDGNDAVSAEEFVRRHFGRQGYSALILESRPIHVLFGIYMWLLIQDPADPLNRIVGFGDRTSFDKGEHGRLIWTHLPEDFGTPSYGERRALAIDGHLGPQMSDRTELRWLFDYWLAPSEHLRQYLWAHRGPDVETARRLIEILPASLIPKLLHYLVDDYWGRYLGWPDLLIHRDSEFLFVEVKSSSDNLSDNQKRWIRDNHEILQLPFAVVKIHKMGVAKTE
jgi:hypothetical protein